MGYEGWKEGTLLEIHQFSAVPLYSTTLRAGNITALTQHKLGRYGSCAGCARSNAAFQFVELTFGFTQSSANFRDAIQDLAFLPIEAKTIIHYFNASDMCFCSTWARGQRQCIISRNQFLDRKDTRLPGFKSIASFADAEESSSRLRTGKAIVDIPDIS